MLIPLAKVAARYRFTAMFSSQILNRPVLQACPAVACRPQSTQPLRSIVSTRCNASAVETLAEPSTSAPVEAKTERRCGLHPHVTFTAQLSAAAAQELMSLQKESTVRRAANGAAASGQLPRCYSQLGQLARGVWCVSLVLWPASLSAVFELHNYIVSDKMPFTAVTAICLPLYSKPVHYLQLFLLIYSGTVFSQIPSTVL